MEVIIFSQFMLHQKTHAVKCVILKIHKFKIVFFSWACLTIYYILYKMSLSFSYVIFNGFNYFCKKRCCSRWNGKRKKYQPIFVWTVQMLMKPYIWSLLCPISHLSGERFKLSLIASYWSNNTIHQLSLVKMSKALTYSRESWPCNKTLYLLYLIDTWDFMTDGQSFDKVENISVNFWNKASDFTDYSNKGKKIIILQRKYTKDEERILKMA